MRGFVAIVTREIIDRRAVLIAAGFAALIQIPVPYAPGIAWSSASDVRGAMALFMGLGLAWIISVVLGASMVGGDLAQGRSGFYFSRPVRGRSIWFGKLAANWLLVMATEVIVMLPAAVLPGSDVYFELVRDEPGWALLGLLVGVPLFLLVVSHAISVMSRARSPWIALDAIVFVVLAASLWYRLAPLALEAPLAAVAVAGFMAVSIVVALVAAGWAQVSVGRTDIHRGHRILSTVLWGVLGLTTVAAVGYGVWVTAADPADLVSVEAVRPAEQGPWIEVVGNSAGRFDFVPHFLLNRETGVHLRISSADWWSDSVVFSLNGKRVAWLDPIGFDQRQLVFADLGDERPKPRETPLTFSRVKRLVLSDRGDRVVVFEEKTLSVYELETGKLLIATRWKERSPVRMARFISDDLFRVITGAASHSSGPQPIEIVEINLESGLVETTGRVDPEPGVMDDVDPRTWRFGFAYDFRSDRFCVIEGGSGRFRMTVRNGRTGAVERDLGVFPEAGHALWTSDGSLVRAFVEGGQGWVEVWQADGLSPKKWPVGPAGRLIPSGESMPGEFSIAVHPEALEYDPMALRGVSLNIDTGVLRQIEGARFPAAGWWMVYYGAPSDGRLWFGEGWTLMEWDPESGTVEHLLGQKSEG
ncbi:MAG: hypothetical protein KAJ78_05685 [Acidobacteria bacterium]|nr:hypothetical protein [Acidobacteriota bacterium]